MPTFPAPLVRMMLSTSELMRRLLRVPSRFTMIAGGSGEAKRRFRHYKGGEYEYLGTARHSETEEELVLYRPLYNDSGLWVRPKTMFFENVTVEGKSVPRFEEIKD